MYLDLMAPPVQRLEAHIHQIKEDFTEPKNSLQLTRSSTGDEDMGLEYSKEQDLGQEVESILKEGLLQDTSQEVGIESSGYSKFEKVKNYQVTGKSSVYEHDSFITPLVPSFADEEVQHNSNQVHIQASEVGSQNLQNIETSIHTTKQSNTLHSEVIHETSVKMHTQDQKTVSSSDRLDDNVMTEDISSDSYRDSGQGFSKQEFSSATAQAVIMAEEHVEEQVVSQEVEVVTEINYDTRQSLEFKKGKAFSEPHGQDDVLQISKGDTSTVSGSVLSGHVEETTGLHSHKDEDNPDVGTIDVTGHKEELKILLVGNSPEHFQSFDELKSEQSSQLTFPQEGDSISKVLENAVHPSKNPLEPSGSINPFSMEGKSFESAASSDEKAGDSNISISEDQHHQGNSIGLVPDDQLTRTSTQASNLTFSETMNSQRYLTTEEKSSDTGENPELIGMINEQGYKHSDSQNLNTKSELSSISKVISTQDDHQTVTGDGSGAEMNPLDQEVGEVEGEVAMKVTHDPSRIHTQQEQELETMETPVEVKEETSILEPQHMDFDNESVYIDHDAHQEHLEVRESMAHIQINDGEISDHDEGANTMHLRSSISHHVLRKEALGIELQSAPSTESSEEPKKTESLTEHIGESEKIEFVPEEEETQDPIISSHPHDDEQTQGLESLSDDANDLLTAGHSDDLNPTRNSDGHDSLEKTRSVELEGEVLDEASSKQVDIEEGVPGEGHDQDIISGDPSRLMDPIAYSERDKSYQDNTFVKFDSVEEGQHSYGTSLESVNMEEGTSQEVKSPSEEMGVSITNEKDTEEGYTLSPDSQMKFEKKKRSSRIQTISISQRYLSIPRDKDYVDLPDIFCTERSKEDHEGNQFPSTPSGVGTLSPEDNLSSNIYLSPQRSNTSDNALPSHIPQIDEQTEEQNLYS